MIALSSNQARAQIWSTHSGVVSFRSEAPLEVIEAASSRIIGGLNLGDRTFVFRIPVSSFEGFNNALQRDHFNENYLESETYPEATFTGRIIEDIDLRHPGTYDIRAKGRLTIHGVVRERIIRCRVTMVPGQLSVSSTFTIRLDDHRIRIPRVVNQKISEEIAVSLDLKLKPGA